MTRVCAAFAKLHKNTKLNTARSAGLKWTVIIMLSKYIQYFLDENNLEIGEEFMLTYDVFEYMFILSKGRPKTLNLLCDRKNKSAGNVSNCETRSGREQRRTLSKKRVVKEYSRRFNVWEVARGLNKTKHPAVFPERLANDHILSLSNKGDVVLDPFCGSGTTAKMAMLTGRKFIGFEISAEYCDIAEKRIASVGKDIPLFEAD